jgi:predicted component of type VI protein secretion system
MREAENLAANERELTRIKKNHLPQISQMSADQERKAKPYRSSLRHKNPRTQSHRGDAPNRRLFIWR